MTGIGVIRGLATRDRPTSMVAELNPSKYAYEEHRCEPYRVSLQVGLKRSMQHRLDRVHPSSSFERYAARLDTIRAAAGPWRSTFNRLRPVSPNVVRSGAFAFQTDPLCFDIAGREAGTGRGFRVAPPAEFPLASFSVGSPTKRPTPLVLHLHYLPTRYGHNFVPIVKGPAA